MVGVPFERHALFPARVDLIEHRPQMGIVDDRLDRATWNISDIGILGKEQATGIRRMNEPALGAGF